MKNKRGLSTIITSLILILLAMTSIGIVWVVVQTSLEGNTRDIEYKSKCLSIDLKISKIVCTEDSITNISTCDISIYRKTGGDDFDGVKIIFANSSDTEVYSELGNIVPLGTKTPSPPIDTKIVNVDKTKTQVIPYFLTTKDEEIIC
jgi:hypothetical protein